MKPNPVVLKNLPVFFSTLVVLLTIPLVLMAALNPTEFRKLAQPNMATLTLTSPTRTVSPGQTFKVDIQLATGSKTIPTSGVDVILKYAPEVTIQTKTEARSSSLIFPSPQTGELEAINIFPGNLYDSYPIKEIDNNSKTIKISGSASNIKNYFSGSGVFASIEFKAVKEGPITLAFAYDGPQSTGDTNVVGLVGGLPQEILSPPPPLSLAIGQITTPSPISATSLPITCKTGLNSFTAYNPCFGGFHNAKYSCYDGSSGLLGESTSCKSSSTWKKYAEDACQGKSNCPGPIPSASPITGCHKPCSGGDCPEGLKCGTPCPPGKICVQVLTCYNPECPYEKNCVCSSPTPTSVPGTAQCNEDCLNRPCAPGLTCLHYKCSGPDNTSKCAGAAMCRNPDCPAKEDCNCSSPTPTSLPSPIACIPEGQTMPVYPGYNCCPGLKPIAPVVPDKNNNCPTTILLGSSICTKCGDGTCGLGENKCNCPSDCPSPTPTTSPSPVPVPGCHKPCSGGDCPEGLKCGTPCPPGEICVQVLTCYNPWCPYEENCVCSSPVPTPPPKPTSTPMPSTWLDFKLTLADRLESPKGLGNQTEVTIYYTLPEEPNRLILLGTTQTQTDGSGSLALSDNLVGKKPLFYARTPSHLRKLGGMLINISFIIAGQNTLSFGELIPGDIYIAPGSKEQDNVINSFDVAELFQQWGRIRQETSANTQSKFVVPRREIKRNADFNGDGIVNNWDLKILFSNFGKTGDGPMSPETIIIPNPSSQP
jgi:hypothetical protein